MALEDGTDALSNPLNTQVAFNWPWDHPPRPQDTTPPKPPEPPPQPPAQPPSPPQPPTATPVTPTPGVKQPPTYNPVPDKKPYVPPKGNIFKPKDDGLTDRPLPTEGEAWKILGGSNFGPYAAPSVALPMTLGQGLARIIGPFADLWGQGAFGRNYDTATTRRIALQQAQMENMRQQAMDHVRDGLAQQEQLMEKYRDALEEFRNSRRTPEDMNRLTDKLNAIAVLNHDGVFQQIHDEKGIEGAVNHLNFLEEKYQRALDAYNSLYQGGTRGTSKGREDDGLFEKGGGFGDLLPHGDTTGATPSPTTPTAPAQTPTAGAQENFDAEADNMRFHSDPHHIFSERADAVAKDHIQDGRGTQKDIEKVSPLVDNYRNWVGKVVNSDLPEQDKVDTINRHMPGLGDKIRNIANYDETETDLPTSVRTDYNAWAKKLNRNYRSSDYINARAFNDPRSAEYRLLANAANFPQAFTNVLRELKNRPENSSVTGNDIDRWWNTGRESRPEWAGLAHALRDYASIVSGLEAGTPQARVTLVEMMGKTTETHFAPSNLREAIYQDAVMVASRFSTSQMAHDQMGLKGMIRPISPTTWHDVDTITRMNPYTGEMPEDASQALKNVGKTPGANAAREYGRDRIWKPSTASEMRRVRSYMDYLKQHPSPESQAKIEQLNQSLGTVTGKPLWSWGEFYAE